MSATAAAQEFVGSVVAITGAASGIGAATARRMTDLGAVVHSLDLVPSGDPRVTSVPCDVRDLDSVTRAFAVVRETSRRLDVLVNNAGIGATGDVAANSDADWAAVFDVNVFGLVRVTRAALPLMAASTHGVVVNVGSIAGWAGLPRRALYSATKGAVHALTLAMAADLATAGIRVNAVAPGTVDTPWVSRLLTAAADPAAELAALAARQPIGRLVGADEVAAAICYLASPRAGSTTGSILAVDGGMSGLRHS